MSQTNLVMKPYNEFSASRIANLRHQHGFHTAAFDRDFSPQTKVMDFMENSGLVKQDLNMTECIFTGLYSLSWRLQEAHYMQLRIVLNTILHERENAVNLMAPDCGSWGVPSRGTSGRTFFNYLGNLGYGFVTNGNSMISRNFDCKQYVAIVLLFS